MSMRTGTSAPAHTVRSAPLRRVLMTADGVGGVWQYALDLSERLTARAIDVTVAVLGPPLDEPQRAEASRRRVRVLERSCRLEWMDDPWDDVARSGEWLRALEDTIHPDVVHLNGYCHAALPWRAPTVIVAHSCVRSWWRAVRGESAPAAWGRYSQEVARGLRAASLVIAPTEAMGAALQLEYGRCPEVRVIPNGRDLAGDAPSAKAHVILAAGRVWDDAKNIAALCEVAAGLPWPVCVAGDRGVADSGRQSPAEVKYLGRLPSEVMRDWYRRAAIYALPARYEPFGLSVLEAAACGCALVLGDIPSLRENWSDAAVFVPPDDRHALRSALEQLIADPSRRDLLARRARTRAAQFTVERMADGYVDAYRAVTARAAVAQLAH
jgi:glycogen synthase